MRIVRRSLVLAVLALCACGGEERPAPPAQQAAPAAPRVREGHLAVEGGRIWYRVSEGGAGTPVILLHGGPGFSSFYLKPIEQLADDRTVVRYDQLGSGRSDPATDTALFNIPRFVRELETLRDSLGYERVHLLGHSWGTILAVEYYRAHPSHVAGMVLASPALDLDAWERNARRLLTNLPDSMQRAVATREAEQNFEAPDYQAALNEFYARYVWLRPDPVQLDSMMKSANMGIYLYMQGPSEFTITGTLKGYDITGFLPRVRVPLLYTVGEVDEANPEIVRGYAGRTPGARVEVIPNAAHLTTWDNPEQMVRAVRDFLRQADQR